MAGLAVSIPCVVKSVFGPVVDVVTLGALARPMAGRWLVAVVAVQDHAVDDLVPVVGVVALGALARIVAVGCAVARFAVTGCVVGKDDVVPVAGTVAI